MLNLTNETEFLFDSEIHQRKGFTLVEFIVVITLRAMMFPTFASVRETARHATCASKLKQMGLALAQYTKAKCVHLVSEFKVTTT